MMSKSIVPGKPFQLSLMFEGKTGAYPSEASLRCSSLRSAPSLTQVHFAKLEKPARDEHSSLLGKFVSYGRKKVHNIDTRGQCYKTIPQ
jgi:hypothetical protein